MLLWVRELKCYTIYIYRPSLFEKKKQLKFLKTPIYIYSSNLGLVVLLLIMHTFSGLKIVLIEVYCTQKNLLISGQEDVSVGNLVPNAKFFLPYILTMEDY